MGADLILVAVPVPIWDNGAGVAVFTLDGRDWAFCGGTSWGDEPSPHYDDFTVVAELGLFDKPFTEEGSA